jgi:hypothetical protein
LESFIFFDQASGTSINFAKGAGCPEIFNNSKTLSNAAESDDLVELQVLNFQCFK